MHSFCADWSGQRAALSPSRVALIEADTGREITYRQWDAQANQTAHMLVDAGVTKGDRVAILAYNSIAYLDIWMACAKTGAILQNLNWRLHLQEIGQLLKDASPTICFYGPSFVEQVRALQQETALACSWCALSEKARPSDMTLSAREAAPTTAAPRPSLTLDDPWVLCYTGGTTGLPKGAMLSHGNLFANAINTIASWGLAQDDVAILNAPLFHTGGLNVFTSPLVYAGGASIVCQGFDVEQVFDLVEQGRVTVFFGVPTMFVMMQEHPRWASADFSRLKFVISGGAPCPQPVFDRFWAKGVSFKTGYGLTEAGPNTFWLPPELVQAKPGAVGVPLMHIETKLIDDTGQQVATGEVGELLLRGPHVTQGYWGRPEETAKAIDPDGWLQTGDLASCDEDGIYSIVGRCKDMIISGGENIYPAEIESVLHGHEAVAEAAVIGRPHDKWGEIPVAVVRLREGADATQAQLLEHCSTHLARYKVPRAIEFVLELPKTGAGKIDKKRLL